MFRTTATLLLSLCTATAAHADGYINIRLSCKVTLDVFGDRPSSSVDDSDIAAAIDNLNEQMAAHGRGYRFVLDGPLTEIGGGFSGRPLPSTYFRPEFGINSGRRDDMEVDVAENPALYAWNPQAVNIYFNADATTLCSRPTDRFIVLPLQRGAQAYAFGHSVGHFLSLCHVEGCECTRCGDSNDSGVCDSTPGSDGMADTLPTVSWWNQDDIAIQTFGVNYGQLATFQQEQVDDAYLNIMNNRIICHGGVVSTLVRLTEKQLDRWADTASTQQFQVSDGTTYFVQAGFNGFQNGRSTNPFNTIGAGLSAANSGNRGHIVMIRAGSYPGARTISTPVTLRAPRGQTARIGG